MGNSLEGRVVVVTGAGRGIGRSISLLCASEGAAIVVNDLGGSVDGSGSDSSPAAEVVNEIKSAGGNAVANVDSVADYDAAENIIRTALNEFGRLDVLVNVAGILRDRMIFNMTEDEWDGVMDVHAKGTFNTTKFASIYWRQAREGHYRLINFTSGSGLFGAPGQPNYAAAKMAIVGLTYSCANSLHRYGVTSNAIGPGAATRMTATVPSDRRRSGFPQDDDPERSPDNVAVPVAYLASTKSDWINGWVIGASGYQVTLYSNPEPIRQVVAPQRWDLAALGKAMEQSFKPVAQSGTMHQRRQPDAPPQQGQG
jgi:NAD(P)-dependent dehydrogenase (short-subunit alcohol dehydrogenase family)